MAQPSNGMLLALSKLFSVSIILNQIRRNVNQKCQKISQSVLYFLICRFFNFYFDTSLKLEFYCLFTKTFIVNHTTYAAFITIGVRTPSIPYRSLNAFGNTFIIICKDPFTSLLISNPELLLNNPLSILLDLS